MDVKKKNFLDNFRLMRFGNLKKPRKKPLDKQGRRLAHRRSISVPDLRLVPGEAFSIESALESTVSEAIFFGVSPRLSDNDSVASGSNADGPLFTDKLNDSFPETGLSVSTHQVDAALNRMSAPVGSLMLVEDTEGDFLKSSSENNVNPTQEGLYAQVYKKAKRNVPKFTFDPVPAPRSVFTSAHMLSPTPDLVDRESLCCEDTPADRVLSDAVSAALIRAGSLGDQANPSAQKRTTSCEQIRSSSETGTPPTTKKVPLVLDTLGTPMESADGTSLESACGTPNEDQAIMPWTTDSEDQDREHYSPLFTRHLSMDEVLLEGSQAEEEIAEVSFTSQLYLMTLMVLLHVVVLDYVKFS